jgi:UDP-N-acetylmuramate dehydrogenase
VLALVNLARSRVKERFGIALETEVKIVGEFLAGEIRAPEGTVG